METATTSQLQVRFKRNDLWSVAPTNPGTLQLLPPSKKSRQKIVLGDTKGMVNSFSVGKHHEVKPEFSTQAAGPVNGIALFRDQIFVATGHAVVAMTKKGKEYWRNDTGVSEPILHLCVHTPFQVVSGDYTLSYFEETTEKGFFLCPDKINDFVTVPRDDKGAIDVVLGCQDRVVRIVKKDDVRHQMACAAPVSCLSFNTKSGGPPGIDTPEAGYDIVYGTVGGAIGGLRAGPGGFSRKFNAVPHSRAANVVAVRCCDMTADGVNDVVVARDDGSIELHSFESNPDGTPVTAWRGSVNEAVTSVVLGAVTHAERSDIVVSTYSGKVIALSMTEEDVNAKAAIPEVLQGQQMAIPDAKDRGKSAPPPGGDPDQASSNDIYAAKMKDTQAEIAKLKQELVNKKAEYAGVDVQANPRAKIGSEKLRAVAPTFQMRQSIQLEDAGTVVLKVELDTALESVALASHVDLEVVDDQLTSDDTRVNLTPLGFAPQSSAKVLAVYRTPTDGTQTRMELRLRPTEGKNGDLHMYVTPRTNPKSILKRTFEIPSLALHQRQPEQSSSAADDPTVDPSLSSLGVTGPFTIKDAHAWIYRLFFDVPQHVQGEEGRLTFRNAFFGSMLWVRYRKGDIQVYTHNLSALATFRDFVTKEAARRKLQLGLNAKPNPASVSAMLRQLDSRCATEAQLARSMHLMEALKEIETQEADTSFLVPEYREILSKADQIEKDYASMPKRLGYVLGILERLLTDRATFHGGSHVPQHKLQELQGIVNKNYSLAALEAFFAA